MNPIWKIFSMSKLFYFLLMITFLIANPLDKWIDQNKNVIKEKIKSVSFQIKIKSDLDSKGNDILNGKIVMGEKKKFRFEMGTRTVVSDGTLWKSFDKRTNQIFIQEPDKKLERALFSWVRVNKLKALPIENNSDGSYKIKLFGKTNDVRLYFNLYTNVLDSIKIFRQDGFLSNIYNISIMAADSVILDIGTESSVIFDLR